MGLTKPRAAQIYNLDYKQATRVVTVVNITLSAGAPSIVDGVSLSLNDRVLVTAQTTGSQNGIYKVTTVGSGSNGTWARTSDANDTGEIEAGMVIMVTEGTIYADTQWKLITDDPIIIGTTALSFIQNYSANSIASGNSNITVRTNANILLSSAGTANVVDVFGTGIKITGTESVTGNTTTGNLLTGGLISATGNVTGNYFLGNVFYANGITPSKIYNGTSEVNVTASGGNVNVSVGGTSNVAVFTTAGEYVTGLLSVSGNITSGNILTGGLISATGNVTGGNITISGSANISTFIGNVFFGSVPAQPTWYTIAPLNLNNSLAAATKVQLNLINTGGGANAGSAIDFYTYQISVAAANAEARIAAIDDGSYSAWISLQTKTPGSTGTNGLVERVKVDSTGASVVANITGGNLLTGGLISATANITGGNVLTGGLISATGNVIGGNISTTGNVTANYFLGNVACASGIFATKIFNGNSEANIGTANGNANISIGGTSNVVIFTTTGILVTGVNSTSGNVTGGNILTGGIMSSTGNATHGNVLTGGLISATSTITSAANITGGNVAGGNILTAGFVTATGNVTGNNFIGNGSALTGLNAFGTVTVSGQSNIAASGLNAPLTFAAGSNISITTGGNTVTIAYTSTSSTSIFATGGDMGLIANPVTASEDLGNVTTVASTSYDLGTLFTTVTYNQIDMTGFTSNVNTGNLNAVGLVSAAGNITGNYILGNGSQLTGVVATATFPLANGTSNINATSGGNVTIGVGGTANVAVFTTSGISATGNITGNYFIGNGSALTGITSTPPPLNINLQQNYGGF